MTLFLASTSPARLALLRQVGVEPIVVPSDVDEDAAVRAAEAERGAPLDAAALVGLLAEAKACAVTAPGRDGIILGGDSAFLLDGVIHGKPHTAERAAERWRAQRGRTGELFSGLHLIDHRGGDRVAARTIVTSTTVSFSDDMSDADIDEYVATGEPLRVAGAFTIDGNGAPFIDRIEGDPSTVIGLSLPALRRALAEFGVSLGDLRRPAGL